MHDFFLTKMCNKNVILYGGCAQSEMAIASAQKTSFVLIGGGGWVLLVEQGSEGVHAVRKITATAWDNRML